MTELTLDSITGKSRILIGAPLSVLGDFVSPERSLIITDKSVYSHYQEILKPYDVLTLDEGEENKSLAQTELIYQALYKRGADRFFHVAAFGGGLVSDMAGFAAATYQRGLPFGTLSTTLLAQVDASVGGKTGVNYQGSKNQIGVFRQPDFVLLATEALKTLPAEQLVSGMGEVIKHSLLDSPEHFEIFNNLYDKAMNQNLDALNLLVEKSVRFKASVVEEDATEKGRRRILNLGHTLGHAIEVEEKIPHGHAVLKGILFACRLSHKKGLLSIEDLKAIEKSYRNHSLPADISAPAEKLIARFFYDKKKEGDAIHFVLLKGIGRPVIQKLSLKEIEGAVYDLCQHRL